MSESVPGGGSPLAIVVFAAGDRGYTARDILDAAWFRGELQPWWHELRLALAGEPHAPELPAESAILQSLSEEIRYRHELITSEETEAWLLAHRLSLEDLTDHCLRRYWRTYGKDSADESPANDYLESPTEARELLLKDLMLAGTFDPLARQFAWRLAAAVALEAPRIATADSRNAQAAAFLHRTGVTGDALAGALLKLGRDPAWFERQVQWEGNYAAQCDLLRTTENRRRTLALLRLPLTRIEVELMELQSAEAAREACFCLEIDGLTMTELAEQEHYLIQRRTWLLEEFSAELQSRLLGAEKGQVLPITGEAGPFQVCRILDKQEPSLADDSILRRVDRELIATHFDDLMAKQIVWPQEAKFSA
jgi:hypothetical protein